METDIICIRCNGKIYGSYISAKFVNVCKCCEHFYDGGVFRNKGFTTDMIKQPILRSE